MIFTNLTFSLKFGIFGWQMREASNCFLLFVGILIIIGIFFHRILF